MDKRVNSNMNVMEYLRWRGDLPFAADPFNEVDQLILCILAYLRYHRFPSLTTLDAAQATPFRTLAPLMRPEDEQQGLSQLEYLPLLRAAAQSRRFGDVGIFGCVTDHDLKRQTQFDAMSFALPDGSIFCAFMGTDTSLVGWKEDLNLSYLTTIPAQRSAAAYVESIAAANRGKKLRLGGHSKGGHLALYAALHLTKRVQKRVVAVYNNDGPGFGATPVPEEARAAMEERIYNFVPPESIVGVLLDPVGKHTVVGSTEKFLLQHEPMSWQVEQGKIKTLPERTTLGRQTDRMTAAWLAKLDRRERQDFCDALYDILRCGERFTTLEEVWQNGGDVLRYYHKSEAQKAALSAALDELKNLWKEELQRLAEQEMKEARQSLKDTGEALRRSLLSKKKK